MDRDAEKWEGIERYALGWTESVGNAKKWRGMEKDAQRRKGWIERCKNEEELKEKDKMLKNE